MFVFHNPKAGGSSLCSSLWPLYQSSRICIWDEQDPFQYKAAAENYRPLLGHDVYMGHFGYDLYRELGPGYTPVTNFRHPAARLISLYNFFRFSVHRPPEVLASPDLTAVRLAKSASFEDFVLCDEPLVAMYTCDHHFRQLANSPWSMTWTRSEAEVAAFVQAMPWFYVCEFPEASYLWARQVMGWRLGKVPRENVTKMDDGETPVSLLTLSDSLYARIMDRNARDMALYRIAVDKLIEATAFAPPVRQIVAAE